MLSILKKITAGIAAAAICAAPLMPLQVTAESSSEETAVVTFGKYIRTKNVKKWEFNLWDSAERVVRDGREGVKFAKDKQTYHFMIDVDDNFIPPSNDGIDVQVEVDYFDESPVDGNSFNVRYTSKDYDISDAAGLCYLENTGKWQTHTFILKDALFNKKMSGMNGAYDLSLSEWNRYVGGSAADIIFGEIRIKPLPEKALTAKMTTDYPGNIFGGDEAKEFKLNLKNRRSTSVVTKIKAEAFDYMEGTPIIQPEKMNQNLVASAEKEVTVDKELDTSITLDVPKYGSYSIKITLDCTDGTGYNRTQTIENYFSVMNKYSDEEEKNEGIGVSSHFDRFYKDAVSMLDLKGRTYAEYFAQEMSYIGFGYVRTDWKQNQFQKSSGEISYPISDGAIDTLDAYNMKTYPILTSFDEVAGNIKTDDKALQTFVDFCVDTVLKHKNVPVFELMNEVNAWCSTDDVIRIHKAVYPAVKKARPDVTILGLAYAGGNFGWLEEFLAKGGGEYMDGISIHLYDDSGAFDRHWWYEKLPQLKEILVKYGMDKKPLWFSEQGWSTYQGGPTTEWDRTVSNVKYWTFLMAEEWTEHFMIYNGSRKGSGITDREQMFGIFREEDDMVAPLAPLPVCVSLNAMNRMLNKTEAIDQVIADNDMAALYRFKYADNSQVISAWSDEGNRSVCLDLGTDKITVYDVYGNETDTLYSDNGIFELALTYAPQYFKGNITKFEETEPTIKINNRITAAVDDDAVIDLGNNSADIKIEVESVLENTVEKDKIIFKCPADKLGDNDFTLRVYANGRLYYSGAGTITIVNPLIADMKYEYTGNNSFKGIVAIKNVSNRPIFATASIELPDYNYNTSNSNNVVRLKPGEEKQYAVRIPNLSQVRITNTNINMTLDNGYSFTQTDSDTLTYAKYTQKKPVIDGKISANEWNSVWFGSDTQDCWKLSKEWKGKDDLSFKGNLMWDEEALYMAVDVTDNIHTQPFTGGNVWRADGIQFGFSKVLPPYPADTEKFEEFQVALSDDGILTAQRLQTVCGKALWDCADNINTAVNQTGTHTIYELKIPWTEIFGDDYTVSEDSFVDFGLIVNDADNDSPRGYMHYNDGIGSGKNYKQFEPIRLVK